MLYLSSNWSSGDKLIKLIIGDVMIIGEDLNKYKLNNRQLGRVLCMQLCRAIYRPRLICTNCAAKCQCCTNASCHVDGVHVAICVPTTDMINVKIWSSFTYPTTVFSMGTFREWPMGFYVNEENGRVPVF